MNLTVKKMNDEDIPFIYHVFEQNKAVLHENYISLEEWTKYLTGTDTSGGGDPYESHHIIMADANPAAWLKIHSWNKPEICISMLVVEDSFKHNGVGRFAIQFAEKQARYWGKSAIRIQTTKDNAIATECYKKCGYEIVREIENYKGGQGGYEFKKIILPKALTEDNLKNALSKMLNAQIIRVDFQSEQLQGGTVGDVRLVTGMAETGDGDKLPYKIILKVQKKWARQDDPDSWRREYDLYSSDLCTAFTTSFRWPDCYHSEINNDETEIQLWIEYIDGVSGLDLTGDMYERAAEGLGRFQGKLYSEHPSFLKSLTNMSKVDYAKSFYLHYRSWKKVYDYIRSNDCEIPKHICKMLIEIDDNSDEVWSRIEKLPIVLCHRDFWVTNIFYSDGKIALIDWDTTGWGYFGEDIASLIADEADVDQMVEYFKRCVPAYYKGFSEYADISHITDHCVHELILVMFGYRLVEWYLNASSGNKLQETDDEKTLHLNTLQRIYEMRDINV